MACPDRQITGFERRKVGNMKRSVAALVGLCGLLGLGGGVLTAMPAHAMEPSRYTYTFHFTDPDAFGHPDVPTCPFTVVGDWDVTIHETDFFDEKTGNISYSVERLDYVGTFSNPSSGKSIPDTDHQEQWKFYFDSDGNLVKMVVNESRDDPYLPQHFHEVSAPDGTVLKAVGRDPVFEDKHPLSIEPLCDALA
jgi:hypothetical protein